MREKQKIKTSVREECEGEMQLGTAEEELHVLRCQGVHRFVVAVYRGVDHVRLLLLDQDHSAFNGVLDAESRDGAGTSLTNTVATVGRLPFSGGIPPAILN